MNIHKVPLGKCQTPEELAEVIQYHLEQGGMRRDIYVNSRLVKTISDDFENHRLYGIALNNYNDIRKTYPKLPPIQIATSDPLSGLAQIQQLCVEQGNGGQEETTNHGKVIQFFLRLYEITIKAVVDAILERFWPKPN